MNRKKVAAVCFLAIALCCSSVFAQRKYVGWSAGYLPNYANFSISKINWKCYTHLFWFSINANSSGIVSGLDATTAKNFVTACHQNNTKAIICVGGAGAATKFETATANATILNTFVNSMVSFMQTNGFDGVDIDWEDDGQGITASKYLALFQGLRTALNKITTKPLLTAAVADYYANAAAPVYSYCDQMNIMSYYDLVASSPQEVSAFTSKGVPKSKLGIGYGYDVDNEKDVNNPNDIGAKCLYAINNGCGGVMVWEIDKACTKCDDTTAYYVNKNQTATQFAIAAPHEQQSMFSIAGNALSGSVVRFALPSSQFIDVTLFNVRGVAVKNLVHGDQGAGQFSVYLGDNKIGHYVKPGVYVLKMATTTSTMAGTVVVK